LDSYGLSNDLLNAVKSASPANPTPFFEQQRTTMAAKGKLPLGPFAQMAFDGIKQPVEQAWRQYQSVLSDWPIAQTPQVIELNFKLDNGVSVQLTGHLNQRQKEGGLNNGLIHLTAQALTKDKDINFHKLLPYWVQHLAGCVVEEDLQTLVISPDSIITIPAIPKEIAYVQLKTLVNAWHQGMQSPLPVACRTAFAWLGAAPDKADDVAISQYEGDDWNVGEITYDAYLGRFFPSFASLNEPDTNNSFVFWAEALYRPLYEQVMLNQSP
jgi:exodeoxyribonuclease V gamma subunit